MCGLVAVAGLHGATPARSTLVLAIALTGLTACGGREGASGPWSGGAEGTDAAAAGGTETAGAGGLASGSGGAGAAGDTGSMNAGGGGGQPQLPSEPENTLLEGWQLEADGAPPHLLGVWDTREGVSCRFLHAEDGELRCLPEVGEFMTTGDTFADARCQEPVHWLSYAGAKAPPPGPRSRTLPRSGCDPVRHQPLRPISLGEPLFRATESGCQPFAPGDGTPGNSQLPMIADAPDRWEKVTEAGGARLSGRLHAVNAVAPDGARFVTRLVDERWDLPCRLSRDSAGGSVACRPPTALMSSRYFADDGCTVRLAQVPACEMPAFIEHLRTGFALGERFTGDVFSRVHLCELAAPAGAAAQNGVLFYALGAELDAEAVAPATVRETTVGSGRFRLRGLLDDDDALVRLSAGLFYGGGYPYFDTAADEDCQAVWAEDGQVRCIPASVSVLVEPIYFSDAGCTQRVFSCDRGAACDSQKIVIAKRDAYGRPFATAAYATSTRLEATHLFSGVPGDCRQVGSNVDNQSVPATPLSLGEYPTLHERHPKPFTPPG